MRMRVVHGNTLTAAVILHRLPADCGEVFLTGGTSKLGRAVALYLIRKGVRVLVRSKGKGIVSEEPGSEPHLGRLVDVNERRGTPPSQGLPTHYWRRVFLRSGVASSHSRCTQWYQLGIAACIAGIGCAGDDGSDGSLAFAAAIQVAGAVPGYHGRGGA